MFYALGSLFYVGFVKIDNRINTKKLLDNTSDLK